MEFKTFNDWTVLSKAETIGNTIMCNAQCVCGAIKVRVYSAIVHGKTKSCGCQKKKYMTSHNMSRTPIYHVWASMLNRCSEDTAHQINRKNYYLRGISVCDEWRYFENFYNDMGDRPFLGAQLDRIDNDKGYCKENCRWVSARVNNRNKQKNIMLDAFGKNIPLGQWADETGIPYCVLYQRVKKGLPPERILSKESRNKNSKWLKNVNRE